MNIGLFLRTAAAAPAWLLAAAAPAPTGTLAATSTTGCLTTTTAAPARLLTATAAAPRSAAARLLAATATATAWLLAATAAAPTLTGFLLTLVTDIGVVAHDTPLLSVLEQGKKQADPVRRAISENCDCYEESGRLARTRRASRPASIPW